MRVLILSNGEDNGGVGIAIKKAFAKYEPDWVVHSVTRADNYIGFERDVFWAPGEDGSVVDDLWRSADVVHLMDKFEAASSIAAYDEEKPRLIHYHGSIFRSRPEGFLERCRRERIPQIAATFDLLKIAPDELTWMPHPIDLARMKEIRAAAKPRQRLSIVHTPGAGYNGTDHLESATAGMDVELDIVRGEPWVAAMSRKARADILFDSMDIGYGMTSVEAFAMEIAVVAGGDPETEMLIRETVGYLPYLSATPGTLPAKIQELVHAHEFRDEVAAMGWQCANEHHAEERVVERMKRFYERTVEEWR